MSDVIVTAKPVVTGSCPTFFVSREFNRVHYAMESRGDVLRRLSNRCAEECARLMARGGDESVIEEFAQSADELGLMAAVADVIARDRSTDTGFTIRSPIESSLTIWNGEAVSMRSHQRMHTS